jgi:hypothetical protein
MPPRTLTLSFLCAFLSSVTVADVANVSASKDNTLYEDAQGDVSNGAGDYLFAGQSNVGVVRRALLHFDIAAALPSGSTINSVTLTLALSRTLTGDVSFSLHTVSQDWGEGASDAPLNEGAGTTAATNDATWLHTFYNTATWTTPGGDFNPTPSATATVGSTLTTYSWTSTQMATDVQNWLDTPASNFGWILIGGETVNATAKRFASRTNPVTANQPVLVIDYTPGTSGLNDWILY